ncbi:MAG: hypothetical protein AB7O59_01190 [Pirellulales bacterium]
MARSRATSAVNDRGKVPQPAPAEEPLPPPRKRPWLLALSVLLLVVWLAFMAAMAWRG